MSVALVVGEGVVMVEGFTEGEEALRGCGSSTPVGGHTGVV